MTIPVRDPLLLAVRFVNLIGMGLAALVGVSTVVAAPIVLLMRQSIMHELAAQADTAPPATTPYAVALILLLVAAMAACAFLFQRHLMRIIDSVGLGDPFQPENARHLASMGWLALTIEGLSIPVGGLGHWLAAQLRDATSDFGVSIGGVMLALILFVLARVFHQGAQMRADLEGTV